jgi:selenocysteine lyase/cysteine desulfurase
MTALNWRARADSVAAGPDAGCHCATLAHHALGLDPPASCRLSFYLYNTPDDVDQAVAAVAAATRRTHFRLLPTEYLRSRPRPR